METIIGLILFLPMMAIMIVGSLALMVSLFTIVAVIYKVISNLDLKNGKTKNTK